ncbi:hypothetical protein LshimejAT787_0400770 [Lyophyllum shimeji]|uniref:Uncharacterized protein n=1 Tax=Lyophyllum shimeji TaxID=47721 RepID=A0A9P3PJR6_LYOSH|nr:hypothetical protein LshimejAT787_0400770 [Lyophyllum shimeji]
MSIVSSYISTRAPVFKINARVVSIMDSIFAIGIGLGVRLVIDLVSHQDHQLTGTLVGLWEGVVMQHFLKKMPKSFDPYVAYGVRVFVDFLFTESLWRLVLTLVWTGMGMILADVAPAIWVETGLRRLWRHFRRDLYTVIHSVPTISLFPRPRTVRFSPSRTASVVSSAPHSVLTNTNSAQAPARIATPAPPPRKRPVPGAFPGDWETETEVSILGLRSPLSETSTSPGTAHHRFSSLPRRRATVESESEVSYDLDAGNISSSDDSYARTPVFNEADMPDIEDEADVDTEREVVLDKEEENTPKRSNLVLPPTPSDSAFAGHHQRGEPREMPPPVAEVPNIPDDEDWENISRREVLQTPPPAAAKESPPTPSVKDVKIPTRSSSPRPQQVPTPSTSNNQEQSAETSSVPPAITSPFHDLLSSDNTPLPRQTEANPWAATATHSLAPSVPAPAPAATQSGDAMEYSFLGRPPSYTQFQLDFDKLVDVPAPTQTAANENHAAEPPVATATEAPSNNDAGVGKGNPGESSTLPKPGTSGGDPQQSGEHAPGTEAAASSSTQGPSATAQVSTAPAPETTEPPVSAPAPPEAAPAAATAIEPAVESAPAVDDEPLPEKSSDRLAKALELRRQATEMNKGVAELKRQLKAAWADDELALGVQKQLLVDASMKELAKLNAKADRWYIAVHNGDASGPSDTLDLSDVTGDVVPRIEDALTQLVLKNRSILKVMTATAKKGGKQQKSALLALLVKLKLEHNDAKVRELTVTIPTTPPLRD